MTRETQTTVGWSEPAIFGNFGGYIFETFELEPMLLCIASL